MPAAATKSRARSNGRSARSSSKVVDVVPDIDLDGDGSGVAATDLLDRPPSPIVVEDIIMIEALVPIVGKTPLIMHGWSEKAKRMMREKQSGKAARTKNDPKDPQEEAEAATYYFDDGKRVGMPAGAFKGAITDGARLNKGLTLETLRRFVSVTGEPGRDGVPLVEIFGDWSIREDTPRISSGVADLRYRKMFWPWSAIVPVTVPAMVVDRDSIVRLVNVGGMSGVGDYRPSSPKSKTGTYGVFKVDRTKKIEINEYSYFDD